MTAVKRIYVSWRKKKTHQRSKEYPVYIKSHKNLMEKYTVSNAWNDIADELENKL